MNKNPSIYDSPFSEDTKKIRRNLLIASSISIFIGMTNQLPSTFALWGAKFDSDQQTTVGWLLFSANFYLYLQFIATAGVEIAKWLQPFYEKVIVRKKLMQHPAFDETDWLDYFDFDDDEDLEKVKAMAKTQAETYVKNKLRHLYGLIYLQLIMDALIPLLLGAFALAKLSALVI